MPTPVLRAAQRSLLKARAHALSPVVMIGEAGLTDNVLGEIDRALTAHELIKIRVAGDDRSQRLTLLETICTAAGAAPVQQIGKLLVVYRPGPAKTPLQTEDAPKRRRLAKSTPAAKRNPISGRTMAARTPKKNSKGPAAHPPRTDRVRKAGQKSTKKAFQSQ